MAANGPITSSLQYRFGEFMLDPARCLLTHDGNIVPLGPKLVETLAVLVEHQGALVQKRDLLQAVWPDTFVEESNITSNISVLRRVLAETGGADFIRTVPKRGYLFTAAVEVVRSGEQEMPKTAPAPVEAGLTGRRLPWRGLLVALAIVSVLTALAVAIDKRRLVPSAATYMQVTAAPGEELQPSLSPDGASVVYASRSAGNWDIYLQRVGGTRAINLTQSSPEDDTQPVFSPDGRHIAFRSERDGGGIFVMGATGES